MRYILQHYPVKKYKKKKKKKKYWPCVTTECDRRAILCAVSNYERDARKIDEEANIRIVYRIFQNSKQIK